MLKNTHFYTSEKFETFRINWVLNGLQMVGLQISFEKPKFMTNIKTVSKKMKTWYGQIYGIDKFKYLGKASEPVSYTHLDVYKRQGH